MTSRLPNGRRLLALRELLGLTQQDLAHTLGISQPTLSKIEKAERPLSTGLIDRARHHYDLPSQFFHIPPGILDIGIPTFRKSSTARAGEERRILRTYREAARVWADASEASGYHTNQISPTLTACDVDTAARQIRHLAGIDATAPIGNMTRLLERLGIGVIWRLTPTDDGPSAHAGISIPAANPTRPLVALASDLPGDAARFTLAHELAHLVWDQDAQPWTSSRSPQEKRAHDFAGALLLPADMIRTRVTDTLNLNGYLPIKADYGASLAAIIMAAKRLHVITPQRARSLFIQLSARGWRTQEPVPVGDEQPLLLAQALKRITTWDAHSIAATTAMPAATIARWTGQTIPDPTIIDLTHWRTRRPASHPRPSLH